MSSFLQVIDIGIRSLLYTKFGDILGLESTGREVLFYPKDIAFRKVSEKKGAALTEFINVWRTSTAPDWARQRTPIARRGMRLGYTNDNKTDTIVAKAMPVSLKYNVWFWTKDIEKLNLIAERYLFWQQSNPNLNLNYTVDSNEYPVELDLHFGELTDESNVETIFEKGIHFCMNVPINIDGWVFASEYSAGVIQKIELLLYDKNDLTDVEIGLIVLDVVDDSVSDLEEALRLYEEHIYGIISIDVENNGFVINKDSASEFVADKMLYVDDSTGNDGRYTIVSAVDGEEYTTVIVLEHIEDETVDGSISLKNI